MPAQYYDYTSLFVDENNLVFSGISYPPNLLEYENDFKDYIIPAENEFRPDKIAWELWESQDLSWVLDLINDFTNGIAEYTRGKTIKYIDTDILVILGIL
ncbi:hypothetical protein KY314_03155 [Candidatus Woesearchaeota archaeon]|nr:hypothetical protein [Candidatus Woesearchaeota archaeon]